jgi:hypothetical protein
MEEPWTFGQKFDFIHGSWLAGSIRNWARLTEQCFTNLNPGGWVEFGDWDYKPRLPNGSTDMPDNYIAKWHQTMMGGCEAMIGASASPGPLLKKAVTDAGFADVHETIFTVPVGGWARDGKLKSIGRFYKVSIEEGLDAISLRLLTQLLGWEMLEAQALNAEFKNEMQTIQFFHTLYVTRY